MNYADKQIEDILNNMPKLSKDIIDLQMCISSRLDDILQNLDIKYDEISSVLNLTDQQVCDYLSGSYDFKISELCYLADILDVKVSDLMNNTKHNEDIDYLLQIHRDFKLMFANEDFEGVRKYIKSRIKSNDNHILKTMLVATKSFKMNYILKPTIDELVSVLEKRTGKKLY